MNISSKQLIALLTEQPSQSILEVLYQCYTSPDTIHNKKITDCFRKMEACTSGLSYQQSEEFCTAAIELCAEQDRIAFMDGVQVGAKLVLELLDPSKEKEEG